MLRSLCLLVVLSVASPLFAQEAPTANSSPRNVVLWINIDGLRPDYIDRAKPTYLSKLMKDGAWSNQLVPVFPSLTFPSHVSLATGVRVEQHGIPGNSFYDAETGQTYNFPGDSSMLRAEAIWTTASRQGLRVSVIDWPLSHRQKGPHAAAFFGQSYDNTLTDEARLQMAITPYLLDNDPRPLQLVMGYASKVDVVGHASGPDSNEVLDELRKTDALIENIVRQVTQRFDQRMAKTDDLYVVITTDHGMSPVTTQASAERLLGPTFSPEVTIVTSGSVGFVHLDKLPEAERGKRRDAMLERLKQFDFVEAFTREQAREKYGLDDPSRVGDIILSLKRGYTFTRLRQEVTLPISQRGPLGMHGYDVASNPEMNGFMLIWRYRKPLGGIDLGKVDSLQLHPTVAELLGIKPAPHATAKPIELK